MKMVVNVTEVSFSEERISYDWGEVKYKVVDICWYQVEVS
jgi:hypothetical protein